MNRVTKAFLPAAFASAFVVAVGCTALLAAGKSKETPAAFATSPTTPTTAETGPNDTPPPPPAESGVDAPPPPIEAGCTGASGCYACDPSTSPEFLNACTSSTCVPFDQT